jgi:DNA-binding response OmpR family regulator
MTKRVLVVDDDDDVRSVVVFALTLDGFDAREAPTVQEGLRQCAEWAPDLVLCDMSFGMDSGVPVVEACLSESRPVIVITASVSRDVLDPLSAAGVAVLIKPFSMEELSALVREIVS